MSELNENWSRRNNKFIPSRHLAAASDVDNDNRGPDEMECELNGDNDLGGEKEDLFQVSLCFNLFTNYPKKWNLRFKLSTFFANFQIFIKLKNHLND
jgi:hypothetical protein